GRRSPCPTGAGGRCTDSDFGCAAECCWPLMNAPLLILEIAVLALGLALFVLDLWTPPSRKPLLGYGAAAALALVLAYSFLKFDSSTVQFAFGHSYLLDGLAL